MRPQTRRDFLTQAGVVASASAIVASTTHSASYGAQDAAMQFGLVTYQWGKDLSLAQLIDVCERSGVVGVELRTEHAHRVEPELTGAQRKEVRKRFADSPVTLVGYGSNAQFHENDPAKVKQNIELAKQYIHLMHDCGGTGVKVKPNGFVPGVPREKTIEQIGKALNQVAAYGEGFGQQIRVEVHGRGTSELPVMKAIFDVADHPNVTVCWNSNDVDLQGEGLYHNLDLVKDRLGDTVHVRELNLGKYPYKQLMDLFMAMKYNGWILLEARTKPEDTVRALVDQRRVFEQMINQA